MLIFIEWAKVLLGTGIFIAVSYVYYHLSGGSGTINFVITLVLTPLAIFALLIIYWSKLDDLQGNKKYVWPKNKAFWLLAIYFASPVLCNGASIGLKWGGYETAAYYMFELRYWSLLKTPIIGGLLYFMFGGIRKPRLKHKARRTALIESA